MLYPGTLVGGVLLLCRKAVGVFYSLSRLGNSSIWTIDSTLSDTTNPGQRGPGSIVNEEVHRITQSSSITETSSSHCLASYKGHSLVGSYQSPKEQPTGQAFMLGFRVLVVPKYPRDFHVPYLHDKLWFVHMSLICIRKNSFVYLFLLLPSVMTAGGVKLQTAQGKRLYN